MCEGEVTEPVYLRMFQHAVRNPRVHVATHGPAGVPISVVETAIKLRDDAAARAKAERDENLRWDSVWAVVDVDSHPGLMEAKQNAAMHGILMAISNPSFELWALWHFVDWHAHIERDKARAELKRHLPRFEKELDFEKVHIGYEDAVTRAQAADARAEQVGEAGRNPTSHVYRLTELIRKT